MELRKRGFLQSVNAGPNVGGSLTKQVFTFVTADWTADGALYYVDCTHSQRARDIIYCVRNDDTSEEIFPERVNFAPSGDEDTMRIWLSFTPNCTVTVI